MSFSIPIDFTRPDFANCQVWRAGELGSASVQTVASGYPALDAVLPGGGWPQGALIEVLQPQSGQQEWGLLAPGLAMGPTGSPEIRYVLYGFSCVRVSTQLCLARSLSNTPVVKNQP